MIYMVNLLYSMFYSTKLGSIYKHPLNKENSFFYFLKFSPIWIVWLLICGGQYEVGTDYINYFTIFEGAESEYYYRKGEWLFAGIVDIGHSIGIVPQGMFFVFYLINFYFFFRILALLDQKYIFIFILLYITLSTVFNNQLNGLRQYSAIYIITYAIIKFNQDKSYWKYILLIILAGGIHQSSYLALFFCLLFKYNVNTFICYLLIGTGTFASLFGSYTWLIDILGNYIPRYYLSYLKSEFNNSNELIKVFTKLIFVPIYLLSVSIINKKTLSVNDKYLYKVGIFAYSIRLFFLENFIFNRVGQLFVLIAVLPIYVYLKYLYESRHNKIFLFITLLLILFYFIKTILLPVGEYSYQSIYFR